MKLGTTFKSKSKTGSKIVLLVACVVSALSIAQKPANAQAIAPFGQWTPLGKYQIWQWKNKTTVGSGNWNYEKNSAGGVNWLWFDWKEGAGDNNSILGISRGWGGSNDWQASPTYGQFKVSELRDTVTMRVTASPWWYSGYADFGVYGWLTKDPKELKDPPVAGDIEVYISYGYTDAIKKPWQTPNGMWWIGDITVGNDTFDLYENYVWWGAFRQLRAFARNNRYNANTIGKADSIPLSINVAPIIRKWRELALNGQDPYINQLGWHVENHSAGEINTTFKNILIPDIIKR